MTKGKVDALLGIVFGDEGKGKVVDVFTPRYDIVARFAGCPLYTYPSPRDRTRARMPSSA